MTWENVVFGYTFCVSFTSVYQTSIQEPSNYLSYENFNNNSCNILDKLYNRTLISVLMGYIVNCLLFLWLESNHNIVSASKDLSSLMALTNRNSFQRNKYWNAVSWLKYSFPKRLTYTCNSLTADLIMSVTFNSAHYILWRVAFALHEHVNISTNSNDQESQDTF
jgi:hypothetical protein